jgi:hypothetical protein
MPALFGYRVIEGIQGGKRLAVTGVAGVVLALLAVVFLFAAQPASAASRAKLGSCGATPNGQLGGQLSASRGVAVNQTGIGTPAGSVYVAEGAPNHRISQFDKNCNFVRLWGYDVVASGQPNDTGTGFEVCTVATECKAGVAGVGAGQLSNPQGIAIDQTVGYLYVTSNGNRRVDVFSPTGQFAGAFGWGVDTGAAALEVCTTASVCQAAAAAGSAAGNLQSLNGSIPSIDPTAAAGTLYVPDIGNARVAEYGSILVVGALTSATFLKAFGWDVIPLGQPGDTGTGLESCTTVSTCKAGSSAGSGAGEFGPGALGSPTASAVDSTGAIYVASGPLLGGSCSEATPCRIQKFAPGAGSVVNFGPTSEPGQLFFGPSSSVASNTVAGISIAIDPANNHVFVLRKESTTTYRVLEYTSAGVYVDTHPAPTAPPLAGFNLNQGSGLAVGIEEKVYSNMGMNGTGELSILGPVPLATPKMISVTSIQCNSATLSGSIGIEPPGGPGFDAKYHFEYSADGSTWLPVSADKVTGSASGTYPVTASVTGLQPNETYQARLVATTSGAVSSAPLTFQTEACAPVVALTFAEEITQTSAELGAHINPGGLKSTYYFEWGITTSYGKRVPATFDRQLGAGGETLVAKEAINSLTSATKYHFRVVASNGKGTIEGGDEVFETLNSCGMVDGRCYELVSPADKGPVGAAGDVVALGKELTFQAHPTQPAIGYMMAYGLPGATSSSEVIYAAKRSPTGWSSSQLSAPALMASGQPGSSLPSKGWGLSTDLDCGVFSSPQPLAPGTPSGPLIDTSANLFKRGSDGKWTVITNLEPTNAQTEPGLYAYRLAGMSPQCDRVIFTTKYRYPGILAPGGWKAYEWSSGVLSPVGMIPGSVEPVATSVGAGPGGGGVGDGENTNYWNAISTDASRVYFTAVSKTGGDTGREAVFLRENGAVAKDVSQSKTGTANDDDSIYQVASEDGSRVLFTARKGLATNGSSVGPNACASDGSGCDLYEYVVAGDTLTDLSVDPDGAGAGVAGVLGASSDGTRVYFAARGQLVPGQGKTEAENLADSTYGIYFSDAGTLKFVTNVPQSFVSNNGLISSSGSGFWPSRVTPSGKHLLFQAIGDVGGFDGNPTLTAYLYSADSGELVCISCRRDGKASLAIVGDSPLTRGVETQNVNDPPLTVTDEGGSTRVFFISRDRLAFGAAEGKKSLYQWEDGQVSFIADSEPGIKFDLRFAGASANGSDIYFTTIDKLSWQDTDGKLDVYDARVGGGIPEPPAPPPPCNPLSESSCQGGATPVGAAAVVPGSAAFVGPGNEQAPPTKPKKNKGKKKKQKGKKKAQKNRGANNDRRAGK